MDITPFLHALCAVAAQLLIGLFTGNWAYGAIAGCTFFIAREHTRAEYRWIEMFGHGKRINMPWWGGFDPRVGCGKPDGFCCAGGGVSADLDVDPLNIKSKKPQ